MRALPMTADLAEDTTCRWQLGPLTLYVGRRAGHWWIAHASTDDSAAEETGFESSPDAEPAELASTRHAVEGRTVELVPEHAPRAVVARPKDTIVIAPGHELRAYVSTPLWFSVRVGSELAEVPTLRPSDTWFGTTTSGELCYAVRTHMRTALEDVKRLPHRAVVPVLVKNDGRDALTIERLRLPTPQLSVFRDVDGGWWSEQVTLRRTGSVDSAELRVESGPPEEAVGAVLAGEPREQPDRNPVLRVFGSVFT